MTKKVFLRDLIAWTMVFTLVLLAAIVPGYGADVSDKLTNVKYTATQNGVDIDTLSKLDFDVPIQVKITFGVPVMGDGGDSSDWITEVDKAEIQLAKMFEVTSNAGPFDLTYGGIKVGEITLVTGTDSEKITTAEIDFTKGNLSVFDGSFMDVECTFNATLEYDGDPQGGADKDVTVEILSKEFTVLVPKKPVKLEGKKYGTQRGEYIDWVVKVDAPDATDIAGYTFKDDLSGVGDYEVGSFKIGKNADGSGASTPTPGYEPDKILTYEFPSSTTGTNYIFFTTKIPADKFYANKEEFVTNTAKIFDGEEEKLSVSGKVTFNVKWIDKVGGVVDFDAETNTGYIIWTITANPEGLTLEDVVITDELPDGLTFDSAVWFKKPAETWESQGSIVPDSTTESIYKLGDIETPVMLQIKAKVNADMNIGHEVKTFTNEATITWKNYPGPGTGVGTTSKGVGIGLNPISKKVRPEMGTPDTYDKVTHKIPWEVAVVKSDVKVDLYVLDLLVYGASFEWSDVHSLTVVEGTEISGTLADLGTGLTKINNLDEKGSAENFVYSPNVR